MAIPATDQVLGGSAVSAVRTRSAVAYAGWVGIGLVLVAFCLPLFVGLGRTDLQNDESIYSFAVDVMLHDGDWLTPKSSPNEDEAFLEKPPLKFWIVAAPIRLGLLPDNEFGLRFWDALFGGVAFLYVFALGRRLGGPLCGAAAVLMLFAHRPLLFEHGLRSNNMEAALVLSYCAGFYHFLAWERAPERSRGVRHVCAVALYFVLAFMTKFVAALFLPLALATLACASRESRARLRRDVGPWLAAGGLAIALIAPWFLYQYHRVGSDIWGIMFGQQVFTRFTEYLDASHLHPWHYYFSNMFVELRASGMVIATIAGLALVSFRTVRAGWRQGFLVLLWFALPLGLMSFGSSKLYHYAYPFLPPVALAAGYAVAVIARLAWSLLAPVATLDAAHARALRGMVRSPVWQIALLAFAFAAFVLAIATYATGHVWLKVGELVLFRSSSPFRAAILGIAALGLSARVGTALRILSAAAIVSVLLPLGAYRAELAQMSAVRHPMHVARDCLQPICARAGAPDPRGPGVWAEGDLFHVYAYYLRSLGSYQQRGHPSDATVFMHLYAASKFRPVLLGNARLDQFTRQAAGGDPVLIERSARKAGMEPAALLADARQAHIGVMRLPGNAMLLLPGAYAACGTTEAWNPLR